MVGRRHQGYTFTTLMMRNTHTVHSQSHRELSASAARDECSNSVERMPIRLGNHPSRQLECCGSFELISRKISLGVAVQAVANGLLGKQRHPVGPYLGGTVSEIIVTIGCGSSSRLRQTRSSNQINMELLPIVDISQQGM